MKDYALNKMYDFWANWFAQPEQEKLKLLRSPGKGGFYPTFSETPGYTGNKDPKQYFHVRTNHLGMDAATAAIFWRCCHVATSWMIDAGFPELYVKPDNCVLRILHYLPTSDGAVGETHCDFDLLTVSVPGTVPGLEVFENKEWKLQEEGVQVGEMLEIYASNFDLDTPIKATPHRVRTAPNTERYKAVFFVLPDNDFELRPGYTANDYLSEALSKAGTINIGKK